MKQYLDLLRHIRTNGTAKGDRTGTGTLSVFGHQMRFNLADGFPLVTTKKLHLKSIIHELLWFLKGDTNIRYLKENGVSIWDAWVKEGTAEYIDLSEEELTVSITRKLGVEKIEIDAGEDVTSIIYSIDKKVATIFIDAANFNHLDAQQAPWLPILRFVASHLELPINRLVAGELGPVYGSQWRSWPDVAFVDHALEDRTVEAMKAYGYSILGMPLEESYVTYKRSIDQISNVIDQLKNNPDSRRMIVSAWNPAQVDDMALPPCHCLFQFYTRQRPWGEVLNDLIDGDLIDEFEETVGDLRSDARKDPNWIEAAGGGGWRHPDYYKLCFEFAEKNGLKTRYLDCQLYQRSVDAPIGLPFNIASYALLTLMVAQVVGMLPGDFVWTGGDCHIYTNQLDGVGVQLTREPMQLPTMEINPEIKDIFGFTIDDFKLVNYEAHPHIVMPVAV